MCSEQTFIWIIASPSYISVPHRQAASKWFILVSIPPFATHTHTPSRNCQKYTSLHLFHPHSGGVPKYSRVVGGILCDWWLFQDTCLHHPPTHWLWAPWHMSRNFSLCFTCVMIMIITGIYSDFRSANQRILVDKWVEVENKYHLKSKIFDRIW